MFEQTPNTLPRIFKISAMHIVEDASMSTLTPEQFRSLLKAAYPEVAHAAIHKVTTDDEQQMVEVLPRHATLLAAMLKDWMME